MSALYLPFAVDLAKKAGAIIRKNFTMGMKKEWKEDHSPLTVTDTTINQMVIDAVKKKFPDHGIIAEEGSNHNGEEYVWVCDPVDGTIPFSLGIPTCGFSIALVHSGVPILGVVYDPFSERFFVAEHGKGALLNSQNIKVSSHASLDGTFVGIEAWKDWRKVQSVDPAKLNTIVSDRGAKVLRLGSFVYQCMLVAAGELVGVLFPFRSPWDGAAVKIIVEEAGGKVTDLYGNEQRYDRPTNGLVVSNDKLHGELISIVSQAVIK